MRCSTCGSRYRLDGILRHHPACDFYRAADLLAEHPDLLDLESHVEFWFGEEWSGPVERKRVGRR